MTFLDKDFLWNFAWIIPLFLVILWFAAKTRSVILDRFFAVYPDRDALLQFSEKKRLIRCLLILLTLVFLGIAAARPSWGKQILPASGTGRDLLFLFDTSKSMLAKDVQPSRFDHAKWLAAELVKMNPGDRYGLIAFAGTAFLECPLTVDSTSFLQLLNELNVDTIPIGGTNIQKALETALEAFRAAEGTHKAVILITDGDELYGNSSKVVDEVAKLKIPLFIAGVGDPSQPSIIQVPDGKGGLTTVKDAKGNIVNSPLNEKQMIELAKKTGGIYVRSTAADPGIRELEKRIQDLTPKDYVSAQRTRPIERPLYPLAAAAVCLAAALCISEKKRKAIPGTAGKAAILVFAFLTLNLTAQTRVPQPEAKQEQEKTVKQSAAELFNKGLRIQTSGQNTGDAADLYEKAVSASDKELEPRTKSYQNLGVLNHQAARQAMGKAEQSVRAQKPDEAEKTLDQALKTLDLTEDHYREAMRYAGNNSAELVKNEQLLLKDRQAAEELKKKIEELKKMQQQAQQQTRQAHDQQKQENQQKNDDQKNDPQQAQQQKKSDGQKNDSGNTQEQTRKAQESVDQLKQKAEEMKQESLRQSAEKAKENLKQAQEAQEKGDSQKAEEELKKAMENLGIPENQQKNDAPKNDPQKQENQQKNDAGDQKGKDDPKNDPQGKQSDLPKPPQGERPPKPSPAESKEEGKIDPKQAESLLNLMTEDEKQLRDELKEREKARYGTRKVEKDW